jgi:hypothetical protein
MSLVPISALAGRFATLSRARRAVLALGTPILTLLLSLSFPPLAGAAGSGPLQPSPLGQGMCQAQRFADGSVQAQIAVYQATCTVATGTLGPAADHAAGSPFTAGGLACKATAEGAGSPWSAAWTGAYYAYSCANGSAQAAFNWGRHLWLGWQRRYKLLRWGKPDILQDWSSSPPRVPW